MAVVLGFFRLWQFVGSTSGSHLLFSMTVIREGATTKNS
jgi:hypothetical protein